jgi:hypothetical protein
MVRVLLFGHKIQRLIFLLSSKYKNLHGINLNSKYWIIQIMLIFMALVNFHLCNVMVHEYFGKKP